MTVLDSELYNTDLQRAASGLELSEIQNKSVLVTGGLGLICSSIVDLLIVANRVMNLNVNIYLAVRDKRRFDDKYGKFHNVHFVEYDALKPVNFKFDVDYIICGAGVSSPEKYVSEPVETMLSNITGVKNILEYAKGKNVKRTIYISSSEIYGKKQTDDQFAEGTYGTVDLDSIRSSYAVAKQASELLCKSFASEYAVNTVIVRPGHIYGPTATERDTRVSSAWAYDVAKGHDIIMKSNGTQLRSYCYCLDCATAILKVMIKGKNINAYNISNPDSIISIRELATILTEVTKVNLRIELPTEMEKKSFNPMSNSSLDSEKLLALGWKGCFDALTGLTHTVQILKKIST